ncbi:hypothetical protein VTO73DRAFT_7209 [Trametes versicolor]
MINGYCLINLCNLRRKCDPERSAPAENFFSGHLPTFFERDPETTVFIMIIVQYTQKTHGNTPRSARACPRCSIRQYLPYLDLCESQRGSIVRRQDSGCTSSENTLDEDM